jgi:hypothetical protein
MLRLLISFLVVCSTAAGAQNQQAAISLRDANLLGMWGMGSDGCSLERIRHEFLVNEQGIALRRTHGFNTGPVDTTIIGIEKLDAETIRLTLRGKFVDEPNALFYATYKWQGKRLKPWDVRNASGRVIADNGEYVSPQRVSIPPMERCAAGTIQSKPFDAVGATIAKMKTQYQRTLETAEGREFIQPVISYLRGRRYEGGPLRLECDKMVDYAGGSVVGKSIDGNIGVILIKLIGVNKGDIPLGSGSISASLCGRSTPEAKPGEMLNIEVKGVFRKYDTGWRLEQVITD